MTPLQKKAKEYLESFEYIGQDQIEKRLIVKDGSDPEITNMIYESHNGMLPDDHIYRFVHESLQALTDCEEPDEIILESDIYTHDLLQWLASNITRIEYLTQALEEFDTKDGFAAIQNAQYIEKQEVFYSVKNFLENIIEENL